MSFKAEPAGIREFSDLVGGLTDDAQAAKQYAGKWLGIGYAEGRMFFSVVQAATNARESLERLYGRLATLTSASAEELDRAAHFYETTDAAVAERLDRTY